MGIRSGLLIGSGLVFTILATFIMMKLLNINLQRTSLGALIIAMGMLVDNAIVVTEGRPKSGYNTETSDSRR